MEILRNVLGDVLKPVLRKVAEGLQSPILLTVVYTDTQFAFKFKAPATSTLKIYDGDGTMTAKAGNNTTTVTHTTSYAAPGTYYFYVEGDWADITQIIISVLFVSGSIDRWGEMINMTWVSVKDTGLYGDISNLAGLSLFLLSIANTSISGDISSLRVCTTLAYIQGDHSNVTFDSSLPWVTKVPASFVLHDCEWSCGMVDNALQAFQNFTSTIIIISGNNGIRTDASDDAVISLITNTNKFAVREVSSVGTLGVELHTDANAASDPNGNETDAITGWSQTGLTTGDNEFISQAIDKAEGSFAFKVNANPTPTANSSISKGFSTTISSFYRAKFDIKHIGIGANWTLKVDTKLIFYLYISDTEYFANTLYIPATEETMDFLFQEIGTTNDGGLYLDNFSLREVTLPE